MKTTQTAALTFRLAAPTVPFAVDVTVRGFGDRWAVSATVGARRETGLAATPSAALDAALRALPAAQRRALVADTALLAPSVELAALARAAVQGGRDG